MNTAHEGNAEDRLEKKEIPGLFIPGNMVFVNSASLIAFTKKHFSAFYAKDLIKKSRVFGEDYTLCKKA